jgi:hypothetical protein
MKKSSNNNRLGSVRAFYFAALVYAIFAILATGYLKWREGLKGIDITLVSALLNLAFFTILIWSIVSCAVFAKNKSPKKTLVLPIYYLATTIITFIVIFISILSTGKEVNALSWGWVVVSIISSLFEAVYASYILKGIK